MIAALFLIETAKSELQEADLPQAEAVCQSIGHAERSDRQNSPCAYRDERPFNVVRVFRNPATDRLS